MIEVLKQMIEALETRICSCCYESEICCAPSIKNAIQAGRQAIAELESQEPVAWKHPDKNMVFWEDTKEVDEYHGFKPTIPLYTHPPQRTWIGLTDEEIKEFDTWYDNREEEVGWCNPSEIVAYIEAKLKEKNS